MGIFRHNHLLSLAGFSPGDYQLVFDTVKKVNQERKGKSPHKPLEGKILALVFEKRSTRTRASFHAAMTHLGGVVAEYPDSVLHVGEGHESIKDTARALGLYVDGIVIRAYKQSKVELYAEYAGVPVINGLTDEYHPCQILADLLTLQERFGKLSGLKLAYLGRPNNITNTLIQGCSTLGIELIVGYPEELPKKYINDIFKSTLEWHHQRSQGNAADIRIEHDPGKAIRSVDAIYTDTWFNTGEIFKDSERIDLINMLKPFQVNSKLMENCKKPSVFLHCLPAERGNEVTDEVIDDEERSLVWKQAFNRLQVQKAILELIV